MSKVQVFVSEKYPNYFTVPAGTFLAADTIELTDEELAKIAEAEKLYSEAQAILARKVKELGEVKSAV